jgi:hypothetical protein
LLRAASSNFPELLDSLERRPINGPIPVCAEFVPAALVLIFLSKYGILNNFVSTRSGGIYQIFDT